MLLLISNLLNIAVLLLIVLLYLDNPFAELGEFSFQGMDLRV